MDYTTDDAEQLEYIMNSVVNTLWTWKIVFQKAGMKVSEKTMKQWFLREKTPAPKHIVFILFLTSSTKARETEAYQSLAQKYLPPLIIIYLCREKIGRHFYLLQLLPKSAE